MTIRLLNGIRADCAISRICFLLVGVLVLFEPHLWAQTSEGTTATGILRLDTKYTGLPVKIDGKVVGATPLADHRLPVGVHRILVAHPEHGNWLASDWTAVVEIKPGEVTRLDVRFELHHSINSQPFGALVFADDEFKGKTPLFIKLWENETKSVRLSLAPYHDTTFTIGKNIQPPFNITLRPAAEMPVATGLDLAQPPLKKSNRNFLTTLGISLVSGAAALYFRDRADGSYDRYLRTGDPVIYERHLSDAKKYDKLAAASFAAFQVSFVFSFYFFLKQVNP